MRARVTVEKAGATASYVGLGSFQNIYTALANREIVAGVVPSHMPFAFKTEPGVFIPLLQRFLELGDGKVAQDLYDFYVPLFPQVPRVALAEGIPSLRNTFMKKYPAAESPQESDIADSSFIDELEKSGFCNVCMQDGAGATAHSTTPPSTYD